MPAPAETQSRYADTLLGLGSPFRTASFSELLSIDPVIATLFQHELPPGLEPITDSDFSIQAAGILLDGSSPVAIADVILGANSLVENSTEDSGFHAFFVTGGGMSLIIRRGRTTKYVSMSKGTGIILPGDAIVQIGTGVFRAFNEVNPQYEARFRYITNGRLDHGLVRSPRPASLPAEGPFPTRAAASDAA